MDAASQVEKLPLVVANDNRTPAGNYRDGVLELNLVARQVEWRPDDDPANAFTVLAFAEEGGPPRIPGPLLRVVQGTEVRVTVRNLIPEGANIGLPAPRDRKPGMSSVAGSELFVRGLRPGAEHDDPLRLAVGEVGEVRFRADTPGTFLYWGAAQGRPIDWRFGTDGHLTGAIIVDPGGLAPDPQERIFVITMTDAFPDESRDPPGDDIFELAINGLSWPGTERLHYRVTEMVRWRWINGTFSEHPMHLHGFHFRTTARGDWRGEMLSPGEETQLAVTELMEAGGTLRLEWTPTRAGNWLFHCHLVDHITPFPERDGDARAHDLHDVAQHALSAMSGLVLGITVGEESPLLVEDRPDQRLWLIAKEVAVPDSEAVTRGFVLQAGPDPSPAAPEVPGPPLILTRGETTAITVMNRMFEPTTVHWHGMELESVYDGVAGWSRSGSRVAPLVAPGESFVVQMTPPRAGTFIYHTHMDETDQLRGGMYGPLIVLEPGETFHPETDRVIVIGGAVVDGEYNHATINGQLEPAPQIFRAGTTYRLRFINISPDATVDLTLTANGEPQRWTSIANDGADLPPPLRHEREAKLRFSAGETYDFSWTPKSPGEAELLLDWPFPTEPGSLELHQRFQIQ